MKLIKDIPQEKYNDVEFVLEFLQNNPVVGEEDVKPIEYFHCFWKGNIRPLHKLCLESLAAVHPNAQILLWAQDSFELQGSKEWMDIKRSLKNQISVIQLTPEHFKKANADILWSKYVMLTSKMPTNVRYEHDVAYASDIIRFVILYLYGGVWFDMDVLFLRNFDSIKIQRYTSQWGTDMCGNAALMRLEKEHNVIDQVLGKYNRPFYPVTTFQLNNDLDLTMLPGTFFDILWRGRDTIPEWLQFKEFDEFFGLEEWLMPPELYAYHWHNRWNNPIPKF